MGPLRATQAKGRPPNVETTVCMSRQVSTPSVTTVHPMTMDFDDDNPLEADRELIHDAAHQAGTTLSGRKLPRHTDKDGRVSVMYLREEDPNETRG